MHRLAQTGMIGSQLLAGIGSLPAGGLRGRASWPISFFPYLLPPNRLCASHVTNLCQQIPLYATVHCVEHRAVGLRLAKEAVRSCRSGGLRLLSPPDPG